MGHYVDSIPLTFINFSELLDSFLQVEIVWVPLLNMLEMMCDIMLHITGIRGVDLFATDGLQQLTVLT